MVFLFTLMLAFMGGVALLLNALVAQTVSSLITEMILQPFVLQF
jgi:hypothetical protein